MILEVMVEEGVVVVAVVVDCNDSYDSEEALIGPWRWLWHCVAMASS